MQLSKLSGKNKILFPHIKQYDLKYWLFFCKEIDSPFPEATE